MTQDRRSGRDRDWTDSESEGQPATEDQPPGIDAQTASEGTAPPADHPVASDEVGVTEAEGAVPETLRERAARERPDVPQAAPDDPDGRLADGEWTDDAAGLTAEEEAVHVDEG